MEWNDEAGEEQAATESPAYTGGDDAVINIDKKENLVGIGNEENEWDRLLRVR